METWRAKSRSLSFDPLAGTIVHPHDLPALAKYLRRPQERSSDPWLSRFPSTSLWGTPGDLRAACWAPCGDPKPLVPEGKDASDHTPPRHLVIVDTVEGFESIVGERDDTGEESTLRARIERLIHASQVSATWYSSPRSAAAIIP